MKDFFENKTWIGDDFKTIPEFYSEGIGYNLWPKNKKRREIQTGDYLYEDSPFKPKKYSTWKEFTNYTINLDTLSLRYTKTNNVYSRTLKILPDTIINGQEYYKIQITTYHTNEMRRKGRVYNLISKKNSQPTSK